MQAALVFSKGRAKSASYADVIYWYAKLLIFSQPAREKISVFYMARFLEKFELATTAFIAIVVSSR